jgi:hypothetical protein
MDITIRFLIEPDSQHSFEVRMEAIPVADNEDFNHKLIISFYDNKTEEPCQVIEDYAYGTLFKEAVTDDVNFDSYKDFYYPVRQGNVNTYYHFWLWNPISKRFETSEELSKISLISIDQQTQTISGYERSSAVSNTQTFYKYINSVLTCIRILDMGYPDKNNVQLLTVQDYVGGKLKVVFKEKTVLTDQYKGNTYDAFFKWQDINYHG